MNLAQPFANEQLWMIAFAASLAVASKWIIRVPVMIGGKLNEVPTDSNSDLPVDVTRDIGATGAVPCADLDDMLPVLRALALRRYADPNVKRKT